MLARIPPALVERQGLHTCEVVVRNIGVGAGVVEIRNSMENHIIASLRRTLVDEARFALLTAWAATSILLSAALAPRAHAASQYYSITFCLMSLDSRSN
jgi:hypothetical protein